MFTSGDLTNTRERLFWGKNVSGYTKCWHLLAIPALGSGGGGGGGEGGIP